MKGYLLKDKQIIIGLQTYIESVSSENQYEVMFEDDTETGYFYGAERNSVTGEPRILDMLLIYDVQSIKAADRNVRLNIIWSTDWTKCGLILNSFCYAVFDFENESGYNRHGFPPPVLWPNQERKLTDEMVNAFFM